MSSLVLPIFVHIFSFSSASWLTFAASPAGRCSACFADSRTVKADSLVSYLVHLGVEGASSTRFINGATLDVSWVGTRCDKVRDDRHY